MQTQVYSRPCPVIMSTSHNYNLGADIWAQFFVKSLENPIRKMAIRHESLENHIQKSNALSAKFTNISTPQTQWSETLEIVQNLYECVSQPNLRTGGTELLGLRDLQLKKLIWMEQIRMLFANEWTIKLRIIWITQTIWVKVKTRR